MAKLPHDASDSRAVYILLTAAIALCIYCFFLGTVCVRLWFYKGALGPEPEKFIVLKKGLRDKYRKSIFVNDTEEDDTRARDNNETPTSAHASITTTTADDTFDTHHSSALPAINLQDINDPTTIEDPDLRSYIAEEHRISRLPAFVQDDCGDGSSFPSIPIALSPIEPPSSPLQHTPSPTHLNLSPATMPWLTIDNTYIEHHSTRASLLARDAFECLQTTSGGEPACEELMQEVVSFLVATYPQVFSVRTRNRRKYVRNELTQEEFSLGRPWDAVPLEMCARLAVEDFQVLGRGEFTRGWYLYVVFSTNSPWCLYVGEDAKLMGV